MKFFMYIIFINFITQLIYHFFTNLLFFNTSHLKLLISFLLKNVSIKLNNNTLPTLKGNLALKSLYIPHLIKFLAFLITNPVAIPIIFLL